jgi:hypothetical protein
MSATEMMREVRAFLRGDQLHLLSRVLPSIAKHYGVPRREWPRVLWDAGLSMQQIEKQTSILHRSSIAKK